MNIHEHQAKALLKTYGLPVAAGVAIFTPEEAEAAAKSLPGPLYVVKSQIHAGGRGKGKFKELPPDAKGGVRLAKSIADELHRQQDEIGLQIELRARDSLKLIVDAHATQRRHMAIFQGAIGTFIGGIEQRLGQLDFILK